MDPLKPFTSIIRSIWGQRSERVGGTSKSSPGPAVHERRAPGYVEGSQAAQSLDSRLRLRMSALSKWDEKAARRLFVECVLISELGETLMGDPAFARVVNTVSEQLASDEALSRRLDELLHELAQPAPR